MKASKPMARIAVSCRGDLWRRQHQPANTKIQRGVDIVVATPGRLLDLIQQKYVIYRGLNI